MAGLTRLDTRLNRRRLIAASGGAVLGATLLGTGSSVAAQDSDVVATLVTDTAGIGDQNFNDLANAGGPKAAEELRRGLASTGEPNPGRLCLQSDAWPGTE